MRPVIRGLPPAGFVLPPTIKFQQGNGQAMVTLYGVTAPTVSECLQVWDLVTDLWARGLSPTPVQVTARNAVVNRIGEYYRPAAPGLLRAFGGYCSYCESPLPGQFDVEHAMPKDPYPLFCLDWNNFLIGCTACNSNKGNGPSRATALHVLYKAGTVNPTPADYHTLIRVNNYVWPDLSARSHHHLPIRFCYEDNAGSHILHPADAVDPSVAEVGIDPAGHRVFANVIDNGVPRPNVRVMARPQPMGERAVTMVSLCGLRRTGTTITDRRVYNRTRTWLVAAVNINRLVQVSGNQAAFDLAWAMLVDMARGYGFFMVWLTLLDAVSPQWARDFIQDTNRDGYFPGTNPVNLP